MGSFCGASAELCAGAKGSFARGWVTMKIISSAENAGFKSLLRLMRSAKERRVSGVSLLDGEHLVESYLRCSGTPQSIAISQSASKHPAIMDLLRRADCHEVILLADGLFRQLSTVETPTGILAVIRTPRPDQPLQMSGDSVWLEDIQDPGNLGSILRSVAAAGVKTVCLSRQCVHAWSPRVLRAGMGAHFGLTLYEGQDLRNLAMHYQGQIVAMCLREGSSLYATDLRRDTAFVFGNEGAGLSPQWKSIATMIAHIPMPGTVESLNVAAAAAICLFEQSRQKISVKTIS